MSVRMLVRWKDVVVRPTVGLLAGAMLAGATLAACLASPTPSQSGSVALATSSADAFAVGCPAGRIDGVLVTDDGSGTAVVAQGERHAVIWPYGYTARSTAGAVEVIGPDGDVVAHTGEPVGLAGGMITGDGRWSACGPPLH